MILNHNRGFVVALTLTELIVFLLFIFMIASDEQLNELRSQTDKLRQTVSVYEALNGVPPNELHDVARIFELEKQLTELRDSLSRSVFREQVLEQLLEAENTPDDFQTLSRLAEDAVSRDLIEQLRTERDSLLATSGLFSRQLENCVAQSINCAERLENAGLGMPACWSTGDGDIEYMFDVQMKKGELRLAPLWTVRRNESAAKIPGVSQLSGRTVSLTEFSREALKILRWSNSQTPACRHFVVIRDSPELTKDEFKDQLLLIEGYFYKYLAR